MECEATATDHYIAYKGNEKYGIVPIFKAVPDAFNAQCHKQKICEGIHDLSTIDGGIVVLWSLGLAKARGKCGIEAQRSTFTPIDCGRHRLPEAFPRRRIRPVEIHS